MSQFWSDIRTYRPSLSFDLRQQVGGRQNWRLQTQRFRYSGVTASKPLFELSMTLGISRPRWFHSSFRASNGLSQIIHVETDDKPGAGALFG